MRLTENVIRLNDWSAFLLYWETFTQVGLVFHELVICFLTTTISGNFKFLYFYTRNYLFSCFSSVDKIYNATEMIKDKLRSFYTLYT